MYKLGIGVGFKGFPYGVDIEKNPSLVLHHPFPVGSIHTELDRLI